METDFYSRLAFFLMILYLIMMKVYFSIMTKKWGRSNLPKKELFEYEGKMRLTLRILIFIVLIISIIGYLFNFQVIKIFTLSTLMLLKWTGFIIGGISLLFWTWAQVVIEGVWPANLQPNEDHKLKTDGPYRRIRHPLYTAMILWNIGISILTTNLLFIGFSVLSIIFLIKRIPEEEESLTEKFGNEYKEYLKRTGRFFPKMRRTDLKIIK